MAQKTNSTLLWGIVVILGILAAFYFMSTQDRSVSEPTTTQEEGPVLIGVIAPLSGEAAVYGTTVSRAYDLAVEEINAEGGINGRQMKLIYEDGKCTRSDGATAAQKLINIDKVQVILGGVCSAETLAAAEITQAARVLLISPSATSPDITDAGDLVFRTYPSDALEANLMAAYADEELGHERAALISENTDFAQGVRKAFIADWIERGNNVVFDEAYETGEADVSNLMTSLRTANAQVIYVIPQTPTSGEEVLEQMRASSIRAQILGANSLFDQTAFEEKPTLYENMILTRVHLDDQNAKMRAFLSSFQEKYDEAPNEPFSAAAYDAVYLIAEATSRVGSTDAQALAKYFNEEVKDWPGVLGAFNFDENGDAELDLSLVEIAGGSIRPIE